MSSTISQDLNNLTLEDTRDEGHTSAAGTGKNDNNENKPDNTPLIDGNECVIDGDLSNAFEGEGDIADLANEFIFAQVVELLGPEGMASLMGMGPAERQEVLEYATRVVVAQIKGEDTQALRGEVDAERILIDTVNSATGLVTSYKETGNLDTLQEALQLYRTAYDITNVSNFYRSACLTNMNCALEFLFEATGDIKALNEAIELGREALQLAPSEDPRSGCLNNLANSLKCRYNETGDIEALFEATALHEEALRLRPPGHKLRSSSLIALAGTYMHQIEQRDDPELYNRASSYLSEALILEPPGHPSRSETLNNLGIVLHEQYRRDGNVDHLFAACNHQREALSLRPRGDTLRVSALMNLASSLKDLYHVTGDYDAMEECQSLLREGAEIAPKGSPERIIALCNMSTVLSMTLSDESDLRQVEKVVEMARQTLDICPPNHKNHTMALEVLASRLWDRYKYTRDIDSILESIKLLRKVEKLYPEGHKQRVHTLQHLAFTLRQLHQEKGYSHALSEAIEFQRLAIKSQKEDHADFPRALRTLSDLIEDQFTITRDEGDLDEIMQLRRVALELQPPGHLEHVSAVRFLVNAFMLRFKYFEAADAVTDAVELLEEEILEVSDEDPDKHILHHAMARLALEDSSYFDWDKAVKHLHLAVIDEHASEADRLNEAINSLRHLEYAAIRTADVERYFFTAHPVLELYSSIIQLLPRVAHFGLDPSARLKILEGSGYLCQSAALRAWTLKQPTVAVELYEEGKAVFWQQALQLRSSALNALPSVDRDELRKLFGSLEKIGQDVPDEEAMKDSALVTKRLNTRRELNSATNKLVREIRTRPGFERFLKIPEYEQLAEAACEGPVVILGTHFLFAYVIMVGVRGKATRTHSFGLGINNQELERLISQVNDSGMRDRRGGEEIDTSDTDVEVGAERGLHIKRQSRKERLSPLAELWIRVVEPIISRLELPRSSGRERPRLHWCPSGHFASLPLHAAGVYGGPDSVCTSDFVVSSYIPSFSALTKARQGAQPLAREELQALLVAQPRAPALQPLYNVEEEVDTIGGLMQSVSVNILNDVDTIPTVQTVLDLLPETHILHLACHGQQHVNPLKSHFAFHDGDLSIESLMKLNLDKSFLAFLSACETAKGSEDHPDQAVHLAASMLFCGFRSVIATMWTMDDLDGPRIAQRVYELLLEKENITYEDVPYALDEAVQELRKSGVAPSRWATFMHMGA